MKKPLIVVAGPTASGKTKVSIELAKRIHGEIISGDSINIWILELPNLQKKKWMGFLII